MGGTPWVITLMPKFGGCCVYCATEVRLSTLGPDDRRATFDHEIPKCRGGGDGENLVLACRRCNTAKGDMTGVEFRELLRTQRLPQSYVEHRTHKKLRRILNSKLRQLQEIRVNLATASPSSRQQPSEFDPCEAVGP
jgi:hypothetical protein